MVIDICLGFFYHVVETLSIVVSTKIILICVKKGNPGYLLSRVEVFSIQPEGTKPDPASAPHSAGKRHTNGAPEGGKLLLSDKNFRYAQRKRQLAQPRRPAAVFRRGVCYVSTFQAAKASLPQKGVDRVFSHHDVPAGHVRPVFVCEVFQRGQAHHAALHAGQSGQYDSQHRAGRIGYGLHSVQRSCR